ncbi:hypothetical protein [Streptomyces sp. NPDC046925]|uniref:hypothetical protein n=1 Tax=Streptomyces sp. NPDC046925 TaxID=3155375 RepID=UPI0034089D79
MFNVFIDHPVTGTNIETVSLDKAYEASAVANYCADAGYRVDTDLWDATDQYAMVSPALFEGLNLARFESDLS